MVTVQFLNLGFLEPMANSYKRQEISKSKKSEGRYLTRSSLEGGRFWYKSKNYFASFSFFDRRSRSLKDFEIYFFNTDHKSSRILKSKEAKYLSGQKWALSNVVELNGLDDEIFPQETRNDQIEVSLAEVPEDFGEFESDLTTLTFFKLRQFVNRLSKTGINVSEYQIILMNKIFLSFICLVFALLPVSSIFNPNRRSDSFGKNVILTLLTTVSFWVLYSSAVAFGNSGTLPPWLATGIVPFAFFGFVIWTYLRNRKLSI
jgi:lipopolysaccharide export system permease protein